MYLMFRADDGEKGDMGEAVIQTIIVRTCREKGV
jgi:hypothetical protein